MTKEEFNALPDNEKCIVLAKDVIKQLTEDGSKIRPSSGKYFANNDISRMLNKKHQEFELQTAITESDKYCHVCALGALFVCDILRRDEFKIKSDEKFVFNKGERNSIIERLNFFSKPQLQTIESYFEGWNSHKELHKKSAKFRMIAIMQNIIDNNGELKPYLGFYKKLM